jgi:hypothetical protein
MMMNSFTYRPKWSENDFSGFVAFSFQFVLLVFGWVCGLVVCVLLVNKQTS